MSQGDAILKHMRLLGAINPVQAMRGYGCNRLAARICDLRREGHQIETRMIQQGAIKYAEYRLKAEERRA
jgi:hypothetical protein